MSAPGAEPFSPFVLIPVYNHAATLREVVRRTLDHAPQVIVVDDGSDDGDAAELLEGLPVTLLRHGVNRGKGAAILTGAAEARARGGTHLATLDADGQHDPEDLPALLEAARRAPRAAVVGVRDLTGPTVPRSATFGRAFSNFWFRVQTGRRAADMQSGLRVYPLELLEGLPLGENRYAFEVEVLVKAAWAGVELVEVPVRAHYPAGPARVTHFHRLFDNARLSHLNTRLTVRAMLPVPHRKLYGPQEPRVSLLHPVRSLRQLLAGNASPGELALSAALGAFLGTLPLVMVQNLTILMAAGYLRKNKVVALAVSQLCSPPFVPALSIEAGHFLRHGAFLTEISLETLGRQFLSRAWEWVLGSLVVAPTLALLAGGVVFAAASALAAVAGAGDAPPSGGGAP